MTVYVDDLTIWPHAKHPFEQGTCHLTADSVTELKKFAERMGLKAKWIQLNSVAPHFDLTPARRVKAISMGAVFVSAKAQAVKRRLMKPEETSC